VFGIISKVIGTVVPMLKYHAVNTYSRIHS